MRSSRASLGALVAGLAAMILAIDTWQPWYALRIPAAVLNQVDALSNQLGSFGSFLHAGVAYARQAGPIDLTAHDVFHAIDVELVLIAVVVVGIVLAALSRGAPVFTGGDGSVVAGLGAVAFCLVGFRIINPPGPSGILSLRPGIWVGLVASGLICVGGLLSREPAGEPAAAVRATPPVVPPSGLSW
jgi:hypothetical protein